MIGRRLLVGACAAFTLWAMPVAAQDRTIIIQVPSPPYTAGSWTPTLIGSTGGHWVLGTAVASYEQIGRFVHVQGQITAGSSNSPTGNIQIGGLPAAAANVTNDNAACSIGYQDGLTNSASYTTFTALVIKGTQVIAIYESGSAQTTQVAGVAKASSTPTIIFSCTYHT